MNQITAVVKTQKIIVNPATQAVSVVNAGPQGPPGVPGQDGEDGTAAVVAHIADTTPHPAYDDTPSLTLIFENGLI